MSRGPDTAVILAGGGGTRLWPWTGPDLPKPLLPLGGAGRTLLGATLDRLHGAVPPARIRVLAAPELGSVLLAGEPRLGPSQLWAEPAPRDTGPAVALAMRRIWHEDPESVAVILPADHRIENEDRFRAALAVAADGARAGDLVLLGIAPTGPSSRFGYLEPATSRGTAATAAGRIDVARFVEKPAPDVASALLAGGALWNGGIFVWKARTFWDELERFAPEMAAPVAAFVDGGGAAAWTRAPKTSIDYALMERAERVSAVRLDAGWDDVGGWDAVLPLARRGDAGPLTCIEHRGSAPEGTAVLLVGPSPAGATSLGAGAFPPDAIVLGDEPLLVVVGPRGILVAPRDRADEVKKHR